MQVRKKRKLEQSYLRKATVLIQSIVFGSAVGVGIAALAVDTGLMYGAKAELQNAADAAALAAASQLGEPQGVSTLALAEAVKYTSLNKVTGEGGDLLDTDFVLGHAVMNGNKFDFLPEVEPFDAVSVTVRRDASVADGPVNLFFSRTFGLGTASLSASATAMLVPRDISLVIDLSASMNDDSEFRHYQEFWSESGGMRDGVQINLDEVWDNLDGVEDDSGPTWGGMTNWGDDVILGQYVPTNDSGLLYVKKGINCTSATVCTELGSRGYSQNEIDALMGCGYDSETSSYRNRVKVILGLAEWKSGKSGGKYGDGYGTGNGNNWIGDTELTAQVSYPYASGSWNDYVDYVRGSSSMTSTDSTLRYRYGLKTVVNYLLEKKPSKNQTAVLFQTPEEPLQSVKDAVQAMIDTIIDLETQDHVSLELFAQYGRHGWGLTDPESPELLAEALQDIPDALDTYQAGHSTVYTNIGAGIQEAIHELSNGEYGAYNDGARVAHSRARSSAAKVIIMLTDGKPNINEYNSYVGNNNSAAVSWVEDSADLAKSLGMTIYTIGVGGDVNADLCEDAASAPENYFFADNTPDPENAGRPMYVTQLQLIFETLGGRRPVRLIQ